MKYLSIAGEDDISWSVIQAAFSSTAQTAIIPMQDILGLGSSARMNTPATEVSHYYHFIFYWFLPESNSNLVCDKFVSNNVTLVCTQKRWGIGVGGFRVQRALII